MNGVTPFERAPSFIAWPVLDGPGAGSRPGTLPGQGRKRKSVVLSGPTSASSTHGTGRLPNGNDTGAAALLRPCRPPTAGSAMSVARLF